VQRDLRQVSKFHLKLPSTRKDEIGMLENGKWTTGLFSLAVFLHDVSESRHANERGQRPKPLTDDLRHGGSSSRERNQTLLSQAIQEIQATGPSHRSEPKPDCQPSRFIMRNAPNEATAIVTINHS